MIISGQKDSGQTHLSHVLKFLVGKEDRSDLVALGGPWSSSKDGGNPITDDTVLIKTAKRWFKEYTQLDINSCDQWFKFMEVHYSPPDKNYPNYKEISVIYIIDIKNLVPTMEQFSQEWNFRQQQKKEILESAEQNSQPKLEEPVVQEQSEKT